MVILNEAKIKYDKLDVISEDILNNITYSQNVNIIVDLKEVYRKFFRPDILLTENKNLLIEEISADIINIVSHYRNYFYKNGKYTRFYFLYSSEKCSNLVKINENYKKDYYEKYFNSLDKKVEIIQKSNKVIAKTLSKIPNVLFIETKDYDEFCYAKSIIENSVENEVNLILSNDLTMYQLLNSHTFALNLKGINSSLLTKENVNKIVFKDDEITITSSLLSLVLALSGNKKYNIKNVPSIANSKAITLINELIKNGNLVDSETIEFPIKFSELDLTNKMNKLLLKHSDLIISNYSIIKCSNLYFQNKSIIENNIISSKKIPATKNMLLELNAKIFVNFPIMLDMIVRGESI